MARVRLVMSVILTSERSLGEISVRVELHILVFA